ncbi:MAG: helix-turn-helix transcriptional regulator [bacterium]|nr:helix-turn-helix transcriptional regulator [bacterium]
MTNFYITQYSIGYISPALLGLIISLSIFFRILSRKKFEPAQTSLAFYFLGASFYNLLIFLGYSVYSEYAQIFWYLLCLSPFIVLFLVKFAYHFPTSHNEKERKIVLIIGILLSLAGLTEYIIINLESPIRLFGQSYGSENFSRATPLIIGALYMWTIIVFIRRAVFFEKQDGKYKSLLKTCFRPSNAHAKTARAFAGVILFDVLHSLIVYSAMNVLSLSEGLSTFSTTVLVLIIFALYITVYLLSAYKNIPYIYKLTGLPVIITLFVITSAGYLVMHFRSISYDEVNQALISHMEITPKTKDIIQELPLSYICKIENSSLTVLYSKDYTGPDVLTPDLWEDVPSGIQIKKGSGSIAIKDIQPGAKYFLQINNTNYLQYIRNIDGTLYGFGVPYLNYLAYMHKIGIIIFIIIILSMALILIILPVLYYIGIVAPLHRVLNRETDKHENKHEDDQTFYNELQRIDFILQKARDKKNKHTLPQTPEELSKVIKQGLDTIIDYIKQNFHDDISREGLAVLIDLDPGYMAKLFKIYTGIKIGDYINKLRIEKACAYLKDSEHSVIDISFMVGFESLRTFNRAFYKFMNETPSSYRNKIKE